MVNWWLEMSIHLWAMILYWVLFYSVYKIIYSCGLVSFNFNSPLHLRSWWAWIIICIFVLWAVVIITLHLCLYFFKLMCGMKYSSYEVMPLTVKNMCNRVVGYIILNICYWRYFALFYIDIISVLQNLIPFIYFWMMILIIIW